MSSHTWTHDALRSEARERSGTCWRLVEAQHLVSTMKLVDSLAEQELLEAELERAKPPVPVECRHLHYLLASPFRYGRYPGPSRFRREGYTPGVFYASEQQETAVAETVFYRLLFFSESPETPLPANPLEFTAFSVDWAGAAIDLTTPPLSRDGKSWTHPTDYSACLDLADAARAARIGVIRYRSVRDPRGRANVALLDCAAFVSRRPKGQSTWRIVIGRRRASALCERPRRRLDLPLETFAADPRVGA